MMKRQVRTIAMLAVVTIGAAGDARAQQGIAVPMTAQFIDTAAGLTLDDAVARALASEPGLRVVRSGIDIALGQQRQAGLRPNPTVTFERREEPGGTDHATTAGVEWPLELFRRPARVRSAGHEVDAARLAAADRERLLAADVRLLYGQAAAAIRDVAITDELVAAVRRQFELTRARADEGAAPPLDRDLMDVELRKLQAERLRASARAEVAIVELKQRLGMHPESELRLGNPLETLVAESDAGAFTTVTSAVAVRPDVAEAETRIALAEARIDQARSEGRADVGVFGSYMRMDMGFPQSGFDAMGQPARVRGRFTYLSAGIMMMVPLFNRNQGQIESAVAERAAAEARRDAAVLAARAEAAAAHARATGAQQALAIYTGPARALARRNLDVVRQTFDLGRATVFDVLNEQRRYLEFETAYTAALRDTWEARVAVMRARGETK